MGFMAWLGVTAVGALVLVVPGLGGLLLPWLGFGAAGVVPGTLAASAQSWLGVVAAGSIFAALQALAQKPKQK